MSDQTGRENARDYLYLVACIGLLTAIPVGAILIDGSWHFLGIFLLCMGSAASFGSVRLLREFLHHGIHNDR